MKWKSCTLFTTHLTQEVRIWQNLLKGKIPNIIIIINTLKTAQLAVAHELIVKFDTAIALCSGIPSLGECFLDLLKDLFWSLRGIYFPNKSLCCVILDYRHCLTHVSLETFLQAFFIVIRAATASCSPLETPLQARLLWAVEEENKLEVHFSSHHCLPAIKIVLVPWVAINEEVTLATLYHCLRGKKNVSIKCHADDKMKKGQRNWHSLEGCTLSHWARCFHCECVSQSARHN